MAMRMIAKKILRDFWENYADAEEQLKTWHKEASKANWKNPNDIKAGFQRYSVVNVN
jgi:mRNA interferase HigB